jgi:hypothetical protein
MMLKISAIFLFAALLVLALVGWSQHGASLFLDGLALARSCF